MCQPFHSFYSQKSFLSITSLESTLTTPFLQYHNSLYTFALNMPDKFIQETYYLCHPILWEMCLTQNWDTGMAFGNTLDYYSLCELQAQKEPTNNPECQFIHIQWEQELPGQQGAHAELGNIIFLVRRGIHGEVNWNQRLLREQGEQLGWFSWMTAKS